MNQIPSHELLVVRSSVFGDLVEDYSEVGVREPLLQIRPEKLISARVVIEYCSNREFV